MTDKEVDDLVKLVAMVQKDGDSFEEGLCLAIQKILISPYFLFRVEQAREFCRQREGRSSVSQSRAGDAAVVFPVEQHAR